MMLTLLLRPSYLQENMKSCKEFAAIEEIELVQVTPLVVKYLLRMSIFVHGWAMWVHL